MRWTLDRPEVREAWKFYSGRIGEEVMLEYIKQRLAELQAQAVQAESDEQTLESLVGLAGGYNDVSAWRTDDGELVICLSHRSCSDDDVLVRVRNSNDLIFTRYRDWETDPQLVRLNHGGNWEHQHIFGSDGKCECGEDFGR